MTDRDMKAIAKHLNGERYSLLSPNGRLYRVGTAKQCFDRLWDIVGAFRVADAYRAGWKVVARD